jgi:subtilisin family serine protease
MKLKWPINFMVVICVCLISFLVLVSQDSAWAAQNGSEKIEGSLLDQISTEGSADFILRFNDQADLTPAYSMDWNGRGEYVYNALRETAERSQAEAKAILDARGMTYQTFMAGNDLYVFGGSQQGGKNYTSSQELSTLNQLAALPEVSSVRATHTYTIDPNWMSHPYENITWAGDLLAKQLLTTVTDTVTASMDWGIVDTKANQFWSTLGVKGSGMVVANIDTGVQWNHPALYQEYKCGNDPTDPKCWYDPANICGGSACDNNGHGTHTMGTMVGDDDPGLAYIVGMAPDAKWIACKGCESNECSEFALNACADWVLAPNGNAANRPNVVNNSWGDVGGDAWYSAKVQAWVAAGIFPAFSAGNFGNACSTLGSPGDYQASFSSAAHDDTRNIAYFSSRGPSVAFGDTPYTKPNISAPGVFICSSSPTNSWNCWASGTSMASPHSAGAVALLWSCNPDLIGNVDATFRLLQNTADTALVGNCGAPADGEGNYTFGYGYLDVLAAGYETCDRIRPAALAISLQENVSRLINLVLSNPNPFSLTWSLEESPSVPWLNETPVTGAIAVGGHQDISITFNASGLALGLYHTNLIITSNDLYQPEITVPVSMLVGEPTYLPVILNH